MTTDPRYVSGTVAQGTDEAIAYDFDFTKQVAISGAIQSVSGCTLINRRTDIDVSADHLTGATSISGNVVTSKIVQALEAREYYILRVAVLFLDGNVISAALPLKGER